MNKDSLAGLGPGGVEREADQLCPKCKGTKSIRVKHGMTFETDSADEIALAFHDEPCPECHGDGEIELPYADHNNEYAVGGCECPTCNGTGIVQAHPARVPESTPGPKLADGAPSEEYWDQNSVQCGNCSVQLLARRGDFPDNVGLSKAEGEDEALCGACAGAQMYIYMDQLDEAVEHKRQGAMETLPALSTAKEKATSKKSLEVRVPGLPEGYRIARLVQKIRQGLFIPSSQQYYYVAELEAIPDATK